MKTCSKCKKEKRVTDFGKNKNSKDGLTYTCKQCRHETYIKNRENTLVYQIEYRKNNKQKILEAKRE